MSKEYVLEDVSKRELQLEISRDEIKKLDYHIWRKPSFENRYPILASYINSSYPEIKRWIERLYLYTYDLKEPPKCAREECSNKCVFLGFKKGYQTYCGSICAGLDSRKKTKQTNLKKFGVEWYQQTEESKKRIKQTKKELHGDENYNNSKKNEQTCLERYGVRNIMQIEENKEKCKQTCLNHFGVECPLQSEEIREKGKQTKLELYGDPNYTNHEQSKQTCLERYGVEHPMKNEEIKNKSKINNLKGLKKKHSFLIGKDESGNWICECPHPNCNKCKEKTYLITSNIWHSRTKDGTELCTNLFPENSGRSSLELKIKTFLEENNIPFTSNIWTLIKNNNGNNSELDIYFPEKHIAIEINGELYHNLDFKEEDYHIKKFQKCQEQGIELISLWGDWIINDFELIKEFILDTLNHNDKNKYKKVWFPDLDDSQWPNDLGWYNNTPPTNIIAHLCKHGKFDCCDSGLTKI